ncbi:flagella basal body P-ring formation protein FlgA [Rhizobium sp. CF080]|uniref:flagellar basal body P-ring formation chaperone FlgA n=1 Tax=Rhizobium sp. (strain CF080) TaxID=1144310 RepID=UPI000271895D|nr:flagellar basal body P-ring formation chaperone FlgA [Rhizobium sp. CF080]EUC00303.1 flagella basal body P-ring formation protein FlgA [Rhizobium sp. CF080]
MKFRRKNAIGAGLALRLLAALLAATGSPVLAGMGTAVVPTQTIYPGEEITEGRVEEVQITNPNLAGDYARKTKEVVGMVAKRTLLPGRTVPVSALREAFAVTRGKAVRLTFTIGAMTISASGSPLENAAVGDVIRVRNLDSGVTVSGTVMADGTIQVMAK